MKLKIKKGATVEVITGTDKGKRGKVLVVKQGKDKAKNDRLRIKISGVKVMTHFDKKDGIKKMEGFIDYSNVKLIENATPEKKSKKKTATKTA